MIRNDRRGRPGRGRTFHLAGEAPALPILLKALRHPEAWLRQQAVIGLAKSRSAQVVPALLSSLSDENREVRKQIIQSLGELHDPRALSPL